MNFQLEKNYIFKINNIKMNISYFATIAQCLINFNNAIFPTDLSLPLLLSSIHVILNNFVYGPETMICQLKRQGFGMAKGVRR